MVGSAQSPLSETASDASNENLLAVPDVEDKLSVFSYGGMGEVEVDEEAAAKVEVITSVSEKFADALDLCQETSTRSKRSSFRENALKFIIKVLQSQYVAEMVEERQATLVDVAEKAVKKGKETEQILGCHMIAMICVQLGEEFSKDYGELRPMLLSMIASNTCSVRVKSAIATCVGKWRNKS